MSANIFPLITLTGATSFVNSNTPVVAFGLIIPTLTTPVLGSITAFDFEKSAKPSTDAILAPVKA